MTAFCVSSSAEGLSCTALKCDAYYEFDTAKRSFIRVCLLIAIFSILVFGCLESDDRNCRRLRHCLLVNSSSKYNCTFANNEVLYCEYHITSTFIYFSWIEMKWKDTRGYPYRGYLPTTRPDHSTGNSVPYGVPGGSEAMLCGCKFQFTVYGFFFCAINPAKSVRRCNSNMRLHYSAVRDWQSPTFPQYEII